MTTREIIVYKTRDLLYENGYIGTSISDIMREANVGKGQLYHYFSSKQAVALEALDLLLSEWRQELFTDIFASDISAREKFLAMLDWIFNFHVPQTVFHGCPVGNLIVELSTQEEAFREPLQAFMEEWLAQLSQVLQDLHPTWSSKKSKQEASQVISNIQGSILLMKVSQNLTILEENLVSLKSRYVSPLLN